MDDILSNILARQLGNVHQDYLLDYQYRMKLAKYEKDKQDLIEKNKIEDTKPKLTQLKFDFGE